MGADERRRRTCRMTRTRMARMTRMTRMRTARMTRIMRIRMVRMTRMRMTKKRVTMVWDENLHFSPIYAAMFPT